MSRLRPAGDRAEMMARLGARLRELRLKAGLTQAQVGRLMGWSAEGGRVEVSRLEAGRLQLPTLALILDYLRACRADVLDIRDILKSYTNQPPVLVLEGREAVAEYVKPLGQDAVRAIDEFELKREIAAEFKVRDEVKKGEQKTKRKVEDAALRLERVRRMVGRAYRKEALEDTLHGVLKELGDGLPRGQRSLVCDHGRKLFRRLLKPGSGRGRRPKPVVRPEGVGEKALVLVEEQMQKLYAALAVACRLDWMPRPEEVGTVKDKVRPFRVKTAEQRLEEEELAVVVRYNKARALVLTTMESEVVRELEKRHMTWGKPYQHWVPVVCSICWETIGRPEERERRVGETLTGLPDSELTRTLARIAVDTFDIWVKGVPPESVPS